MTKPTTDLAEASPTKQFFVSMLTRDISLADAILDLVDNCLDGALRLANGDEVDYAQHFVKIELAADHFSIEDNCGGIPRDVAKNYAFKMGREPDDQRDAKSETIGMYGVGMKRAIFKMGREARFEPAMARTRSKFRSLRLGWMPRAGSRCRSTNQPKLPKRSTSPARRSTSKNYTTASPGTLPMMRSRMRCARPCPNISRCFSSGASRSS